MKTKLPITGDYPKNWGEIGDRVRAEAGHRCIRCGHQYRTGQHGKGEWSLCDERCTHGGPIGFLESGGAVTPALVPSSQSIPELMKASGKPIVAQWRILTVHHLDGDKSNCSWWNLLSLCQRCRLEIQGRFDPRTPYFLEHSAWFQPYVAGFYAKKYEGKEITREEAGERLYELLAYERLA